MPNRGKALNDMGFIHPNWPCAPHIKACSTVRFLPHLPATEYSHGVYAGLNLGNHVGDASEQVQKNRDGVERLLNLPSHPIWLQQTHSTDVINHAHAQQNMQADAIIAYRDESPTAVCTVMTADCLPVLLTDWKGSAIGAVHAGWKGLLNGVIENAVSALGTRPHTVMAWLAPAIGATAFEVGQEVVDAFVDCQSDAQTCFTPSPHHDKTGTWLADIYALAKLRLNVVGVKDIYGGEYCTYSDEQRFYSYRRACHQPQNRVNDDAPRGATGRMASLIWFGDVIKA